MGNGGAERARPVRSGSLENLDLAAGGFWHTAVHTLSELGELGGRPGIDTALLCHYLSRVHGWVSASFSFSPLILNYGLLGTRS